MSDMVGLPPVVLVTRQAYWGGGGAGQGGGVLGRGGGQEAITAMAPNLLLDY